MLVHNRSKYSFVSTVATLLLLANLATALYFAFETGWLSSGSNVWFWSMNITWAASACTYSVGHWILAQKYYCISTEIP